MANVVEINQAMAKLLLKAGLGRSYYDFFFLIKSGPSPAATIDSLRIYPLNQIIAVEFGFAPAPQKSHNYINDCMLVIAGSRIKVQIRALYRFHHDEDGFLFVGDVLEGEYEDKSIVGIYCVNAHIGGFDFVEEE